MNFGSGTRVPRPKPTVRAPVTAAAATGATTELPKLIASRYRIRVPYAQSSSALLRRTILVLTGPMKNAPSHLPVNSGATDSPRNV
ncbi:Uncharacterised protein [Mycobacteroides abscessus subsp. abscessus]|nr:Uncharacterised protein [Mycobacteroides abscessus subsp. abscessus]SKT71031.1 Uncharacterised protein [Mycobacteroides abscessus subsp. abscessus]